MVTLSLKPGVRSVASESSSDDSDEGCWKDVGGDLRRSAVPARMRYICRLLERAHSLGVRVERFYVTDTGEGKPQHRRIALSHRMIHAMALHGADFSYGVFSPFYRASRYAVDGYYVLRFSREYQEVFGRFVRERMQVPAFHAFPCQFEEVPYIIFDAGENGLEYFLREVAGVCLRPRRGMWQRIDYFTNGPWC